METRPDLQAAGATLRGKQAALTANKWGRLPQIVASVGYKKQVDDFKGAVVQINFGFPLFNRNQGNVRSASAALSQRAHRKFNGQGGGETTGRLLTNAGENRIDAIRIRVIQVKSLTEGSKPELSLATVIAERGRTAQCRRSHGFEIPLPAHRHGKRHRLRG